MNTLSLFNGMSVGRMALEALGITGTYYSSEVDKYAIQASNALYPDTVQLGDVTKWREWDIDWSSIDLVTGGFPCQPWSMAGEQLGDRDERGMLFWVMLDIMKHVKLHNPDADFMIENVKMKKEFEQYITTHTENALGHVHKILINSALVSAQNRNRYYWTSFPVEQPKDRGILLKDIIEHDVDEKFELSAAKIDRVLNAKRGKGFFYDRSFGKIGTIIAEYGKLPTDAPYIKCGSMIGRKINPETGKRDDYNPNLKAEQRIEVRNNEKTGTLTTVQKDNLVISANKYRKLTPRECMRLQTIPEHHIDTLLGAGISNTQLYKMTGNAWTREVVKHILNSINKDNKNESSKRNN